jgi:hypothetical protein
MGEASEKQFVEAEDYLLSKQSKDNNCIFYKILLNSNKTLKHYYFFLVFLFF